MDLSQYLEQGQLDSHGRFTMDPVRARELLRQYMLPNPRHYVLCLVSFLVGMGARGVEVKAFPDRLEIQGTGLLLPRELLANPLEGLFSGRDHPVLRELALGFNAALGLAPIRLRSGGLEGRYGKEFSLGDGPPGETVFVVQTRPAGELEILADHFKECAVEVLLQGQKLNAALVPPSDCFVLELGGQGLSVCEPAARHVMTHPAPLQASCWLGELSPRCCWVYLGRTYEMPMPWSLGDLGLQLWVACDQIDRDLSLGQVLENERYQRICDYLKEHISRGLDEVLELYLGGWRLPQARQLVLYALERMASNNRPRLALELQQALGVHSRADRLRLELLEGRTVVEFDAVGPELAEAARAFQAIKGVRHHLSSRMLFRAGEQAYSAGDYTQAARFFEPYLSTDPPRADEVRAQYGHCLLLQGHLQESRFHLCRAIKAGGEQRWVIEALEHLASVESALGRPKQAMSCLLQVLSRRQAAAGSRSPTLGLVLRKLAALSAQLGDAKGVAQYENWAGSLEAL